MYHVHCSSWYRDTGQASYRASQLTYFHRYPLTAWNLRLQELRMVFRTKQCHSFFFLAIKSVHVVSTNIPLQSNIPWLSVHGPARGTGLQLEGCLGCVAGRGISRRSSGRIWRTMVRLVRKRPIRSGFPPPRYGVEPMKSLPSRTRLPNQR